MKRNILSALALLFLSLFTVSTLQAGYRLDPWGSKTWTGPGRPPHWSPKSNKQHHSVKHGKSIKHGRKIHRSHRFNGKGGFWKDKHNRWHHHKIRRFGHRYYRAPRVQEVIVERDRPVPVYIPVQRKKPARLQCGGNTVTRNDSKTGEMIIEYVTGARDCS